MEADILDKTKENVIEGVGIDIASKIADMRLKMAEANVAESTINEKIKLVQQSVVEQMVDIGLKSKQTELAASNINLNQQQIKTLAEQINQRWADVATGQGQLKLGVFKAELEAQYPGITKVLGRTLDDVLRGIEWSLDPNSLKERKYKYKDETHQK